MRELQVAKEIILTYLDREMNLYTLDAKYEISHNNKEVLTQHIEALIKIFQKALDQVKENDE